MRAAGGVGGSGVVGVCVGISRGCCGGMVARSPQEVYVCLRVSVHALGAAPPPGCDCDCGFNPLRAPLTPPTPSCAADVAPAPVGSPSGPSRAGCRPYLQVFKGDALLFSSAHAGAPAFVSVDEGALRFPVDTILHGDVVVRGRHAAVGAPHETLFRAAFHTGCVCGCVECACVPMCACTCVRACA
jgi:hypothetical protein